MLMYIFHCSLILPTSLANLEIVFFFFKFSISVYLNLQPQTCTVHSQASGWLHKHHSPLSAG